MLAAGARLDIILLLAEGERDVGTLATEIGQSVAAVSQHLAKLKLAGFVRSRREGRRQVYLVDDPTSSKPSDQPSTTRPNSACNDAADGPTEAPDDINRVARPPSARL
jgi:DNA-binding transcriptional ArsR family regulator